MYCILILFYIKLVFFYKNFLIMKAIINIFILKVILNYILNV